MRSKGIIFFILLSVVSKAQKDSSGYDRFFFNAFVSFVRPGSAFAQYGLNGIAGIPTNGKGAGIGINYFFSKYLGVSLDLIYSSNESMAPGQNQLNPTYPGGGLGGGYRVTSYNYWSGNWTTNNFIFGVIGKIGTSRVTLQYKLGTGVQQIQSPETRVHRETYGWGNVQSPGYGQYETVQFAESSQTFAVNTGIRLNVKIFKGLGVFCGGEILNSYVYFNSTHPHIVLYLITGGVSYGLKG